MKDSFPPPGWIAVEGKLLQGHRVASGTGKDKRYPAGTLQLQQPFFRERGLDLSPYHDGTLNLDIAPHRFRLIRPEFSFDQVEWTHLHPPENFRFSRVWVERGGKRRSGLIYYPDPATKAAHFQPATVIEVIAERIDALDYGDRVTLWINPAEVELSGPGY